MGKRHLLSIAIGLLLITAGTAGADDPHKGVREAKIKDLEAEVNKLVKMVKDAEKMKLCAGSGGNDPTASPPADWSPSPPPLTPEQQKQQDQKDKKKQRREAAARLAGKGPKKPSAPKAPPAAGSFCRSDYVAVEKKIFELIEVVDDNNDATGGTPRDDKAGWIKSKWHEYHTSFGSRLDTLATMKRFQYSPPHARMKCKAISEAQVARAKAAHQHLSTDEMEDARHQAEQDETTADSIVSTELSRRTTEEQSHKSILTFAPNDKFDGAWKPVFEALHHSAKKIFDQWKDEWVLAERECVEPAKGDEHAGVKAEEDALFAEKKQQLVNDLKKWREDAHNKIYQYDCESMKKMHKHYCEENDGDKDPEIVIELGKYDAEADKLKDEMKLRLVEPDQRLDDLSTEALQLGARRNGRMGTVEAYQGWLKEMDEIRDQVRAERDQLDKVRYGGIFQGSRNPKLQMWTTYGVQRHDEMSEQDKKYPDASGQPCTLADVEFCQERETDEDGNEGNCIRKRRPDCIVIPTCQIFEFKPNSSWAIKAGNTQLADYKKIVEKHYQTALDKKKAGTLNYGTIGGADVLEQVEKVCAPEGKVTFQISNNVKTYEKCKETEYTCSKPAGGP